ncbi:transglycosylase family protein [Streptomyces sp. NPDC057950]|uniref:transglycosylase family protein n=1 Tax=Streptomyces sp. NPDC057950 TaxID=3346288 RepID=UPI0036E391EF
MLSGNGRHRRPRQAPALIVAAGVTGSAIVIPLLAAASANAADGTTWDRVAQCESGGAWSANESNGYYGGLQLDQGNWEAHGGLEYAPTADQASRSQQIAVAEKVLADKGLAAWPACGPLSGLTKDSGGVSVDTGVAGDSSSAGGHSDSYIPSGLATSPGASSSSDSSGSGDPSDAAGSAATSSASQSSDGSDTATGKSDESSKSGQGEASSTPSGSSSSGVGRHRGEGTESTADSRTGNSTGRHAASPEADASDTGYVGEVSGNGAFGFGSGWGDLSKVDTGSGDSGFGSLIPGRSIADTPEMAQQ